ncbi:MAG: hypothetical protein AAGA42_14390 [Actinomycetota bacterium]
MPGYSTVFDALPACYARLCSIKFPAHPSTGVQVPQPVYMPGADEPEEFEWIQLVGKVTPEDGETTSVGPVAIRESYLLHIRVQSWVPGSIGPAVTERLGELCEPIQAEFRDITGDNPTGRPKLLDLGGREQMLGTVFERIELGPVVDNEGWGQIADMYLRVVAEI